MLGIAIKVPNHPMTGKWRFVSAKMLALVAAITLATIVIVIAVRNRPITLRGAVIRDSTDPNKQAPIAGAQIIATDGTVVATSKTDTAGAFKITLRRSLIRRHSVTLSVRHAGYKPLDIFDPIGDQLYIARMVMIPPPTPAEPERPDVKIGNVTVRYTVKTQAVAEIGGAVKTFDVVNKGKGKFRRSSSNIHLLY